MAGKLLLREKKVMSWFLQADKMLHSLLTNPEGVDLTYQASHIRSRLFPRLTVKSSLTKAVDIVIFFFSFFGYSNEQRQ